MLLLTFFLVCVYSTLTVVPSCGTFRSGFGNFRTLLLTSNQLYNPKIPTSNGLSTQVTGTTVAQGGWAGWGFAPNSNGIVSLQPFLLDPSTNALYPQPYICAVPGYDYDTCLNLGLLVEVSVVPNAYNCNATANPKCKNPIQSVTNANDDIVPTGQASGSYCMSAFQTPWVNSWLYNQYSLGPSQSSTTITILDTVYNQYTGLISSMGVSITANGVVWFPATKKRVTNNEEEEDEESEYEDTEFVISSTVAATATSTATSTAATTTTRTTTTNPWFPDWLWNRIIIARERLPQLAFQVNLPPPSSPYVTEDVVSTSSG